MITAQLYRAGTRASEAVDLTRARELIARNDTFLWLDAVDPTDDDLEQLAATFGLHPLAIEDVKHGQQRTKVELDHDVAFVVLRPIGLTDDDMIEQELFAFVGTRFLVTLRPSPAFEMREVVSRWERQPDLFGEGGGFAIYVLIDEVVDDYLTAIERFEDRTDDLENAVFAEDGADTDQDIQQALFRLKRQVVHLRRFAMPVRAALDRLQERPEMAPPSLGPYFRDATDHVLRVVDLADNVRDLLTSLLEVRVAQAANRLNDIMKRVTSWGAVILVPTLIAGIYGMNFRQMPELRWELGYPMSLLTMALAGGGVWWFFRRKDWL